MNAHAASLPLYSVLLRFNEKPAYQALTAVIDTLCTLHLTRDIQPIIVISDSATSINLEPETQLGHDVLSEVKNRSEFLPCPKGQCEYDASGSCRWCGAMK